MGTSCSCCLGRERGSDLPSLLGDSKEPTVQKKRPGDNGPAKKEISFANSAEDKLEALSGADPAGGGFPGADEMPPVIPSSPDVHTAPEVDKPKPVETMSTFEALRRLQASPAQVLTALGAPEAKRDEFLAKAMIMAAPGGKDPRPLFGVKVEQDTLLCEGWQEPMSHLRQMRTFQKMALAEKGYVDSFEIAFKDLKDQARDWPQATERYVPHRHVMNLMMTKYDIKKQEHEKKLEAMKAQQKVKEAERKKAEAEGKELPEETDAKDVEMEEDFPTAEVWIKAMANDRLREFEHAWCQMHG